MSGEPTIRATDVQWGGAILPGLDCVASMYRVQVRAGDDRHFNVVVFANELFGNRCAFSSAY